MTLGKLRLIGALGVFGVLFLVGYLFFIGSHNADNPGAFLQFGKTETHNNTASTTTSTASGNACFSARRLLILNRSGHPVAQRIAHLLRDRLRELPWIQQVDFADPSTAPDKSRAPDLFLTLDLAQFDQSGLLHHTTRAVLNASLGSAPWQSTCYSGDSSTAPLLHFDWNTHIESESTFTGIHSDRYRAIVDDLGGSLLAGVSNQIAGFAEKYPPLPELPAEFYGPYVEAAGLAALKAFGIQPLYSSCGLFTHNETYWSFEPLTDASPELQRLADQLITNQWKTSLPLTTNLENFNARFNRGDERLEIFRLRDSDTYSPGRSAARPQRFIIHYRKPFTEAEQEKAVDKLLARADATDVVMPFEESLNRAQRQRLDEMLEHEPLLIPQHALRLAQLYFKRADTNAALNMLLSAKALSTSLDDPSSVQSDVDELAKKISHGKKLDLEIPASTYRGLGFLEITNGTQSFTFDCLLIQPVRMFAMNGGHSQTVTLKIGPPQKEAYPWTMLQTREGSRSTSKSTFNRPPQGPWTQAFTFDDIACKFSILPSADSRQMTVTIQTQAN